MKKDPKKIRVLELIPGEDHASKPSELIQIRGHDNLSLIARRAITILWHNAHRQGIEPHKTYSISLDRLVSARHKGTEAIGEAIETLMKTLVVMPLPGGGTRRAQVLGGNDMDDPNRSGGMLRYRFDQNLIEILKDSSIWGRISIPELMVLSSKYSISLYEHVSQWLGLHGKTTELFTIEEFRALLGVEDGKYNGFGQLNQRVIKEAVEEINALAPFNVLVRPEKTGKKVTHIRLGWGPKTIEQRQEAYAEAQRSRIGRRARITGQTEMILEDPLLDPVPPVDNSPKT